jgi:hypothetical protein
MHVTVEGRNTPLLARAADAEALTGPLPDAPGVTLLPKFDAMVLGWKDPSRVLDGGDRDAVSRPAGQVETEFEHLGTWMGARKRIVTWND